MTAGPASGWAGVDARARTAKRAVFAETRRRLKLLREKIRNGGVAIVNISAKQLRRAGWLRARVHKQMHEIGEAKKRVDTYRAEWRVERDIARVVSGSDPIIVGPWLSEVGYEVLYWVPFVRWIQSRHGIPADRLVIVTRGGAASWYSDITTNAVELFDLMSPDEYAAANAQRSAEDRGTLKQFVISSMDQRIVAEAQRRIGAARAQVLHPSLLYQLFHQFWLGHRPPSFLDRRTRYRRIAAPNVAVPPLPADFVAVKLYTAASLPPTDAVRRALRSIVVGLAERTPVVMLDTGLSLDDHEDYSFAASRIHSVRDALTPRDNLAVQTAIISRASSFVGTCGALAWLAPMLGVDTTAILADARFLHGHLQVARRVYQLIGGGRFSPLDISAFEQLGLSTPLIN
ncbi:MAG TPA: hypothetical protein VFU28_11685 [Vicinamibacterales bacterium]|nr:hypothetical protein [Vicinamibacterales bacterium]